MLRFQRFALKNTNALKRAQLDIKGIINNPEAYRTSILRRTGASLTPSIDFLLSHRDRQLELQKQIDQLRKKRNELNQLMKSNRLDDTKLQLTQIKHQLKPLEVEYAELDEQIYAVAEDIPNLLDDTVPSNPHTGDIVEFINCTSEADAEQSLPATSYDHKQIGEKLGIMEFATALRIAGSLWYYLLGDGAMLEQALVLYALAKARAAGYTVVIPPLIVRNEVVAACGFKPQDQNGEKQVYELVDEGCLLIGTSEIPLGALHSSQTIVGTKKYVGVSRSYRAEAGARGKDTKGLYRVHEFTKVELFHFTTTADAAKQELEDLRRLQTEIIGDLGLKAKMINMPTTDLGAPAMKKYDCEAWMPGRQSWGELTSSSNCGDYQARRLGTKWKGERGEAVHAMTLNGTAMAVPRVIIAIIEQCYDPLLGTITVPQVLQPYLGTSTIGPQN